MALVTDDAITLAVRDYSETSQIVTLLTRQSGKLTVLAKGSKRPKSPFGGPIDKLQHVQVVFTVRARGGMGTLVELAERPPSPAPLAGCLPAFYAASYAAELVVLGTEELDPHPVVFKLLSGFLRRLSRPADSAILLYRFEVRLLGELGLMPRLRACVSCGRERPEGRADEPNGRASGATLFSPDAGGVLCRKCRAGATGISVSAKALDALAFLAAADDDQADRVRLAPKTAADMRKLLEAYWPHVLGRRPRAARWAP